METKKNPQQRRYHNHPTPVSTTWNQGHTWNPYSWPRVHPKDACCKSPVNRYQGSRPHFQPDCYNASSSTPSSWNGRCEIALLIAFAVNAFNILPPFRRGFFCNDQTLMYPYQGDTVTPQELNTITFIVLPLLVLVVEIIHLLLNTRPYSQYLRQLASNWYNTVSIYFIGLFLSTLIMEVIKLSAGRLRPHYFDTCKPDYGFGLNCKALDYVTNFTCTNTDALMVADASQSFPSGHSTMATFAMFYVAMYLEVAVRRQWKIMTLLCPILQAISIIYGFYVCVSRVSDNRHHPTDVIAGALLGTSGSFLTMYYLSDLLDYKPITNVETEILLIKDSDNDNEKAPVTAATSFSYGSTAETQRDDIVVP